MEWGGPETEVQAGARASHGVSEPLRLSHGTLFLKHPQEKQQLLEKPNGTHSQGIAHVHPPRPGLPLHPVSDGMLGELKL